MQNSFRAVRVRAGLEWCVVLTTHEGTDHEVGGFKSAEEARSWAERETGLSVAPPHLVAANPPGKLAS